MSSTARPRVLLTGGSSYIGQFVIRALVSRGVVPRVAVRDDAAARRAAAAGGSPFSWDLRHPGPREPADVLLHGAGIGYAPRLREWVGTTGAERVVCISSASVAVQGHPKADVVARMERDVHALPCPAVIVRPTMVFGGARDRNVRLLHRLVSRLPAVPRLTGGQHVQPVFVDDLAAVLAILAVSSARAGETLTYGGPAPLLIGDIVRDLARATGTPIVPVPVPVRALSALAKGSRLDRSRIGHAVTMLQVARTAPDPDALGLPHQATPWANALSCAVARYRDEQDLSRTSTPHAG